MKAELRSYLILFKESFSPAFILNILPVLISFIYVLLFSVNMVTLHDWSFLEDIANQQGDLLERLWKPANGHRNFLVKVIYLANYHLTDFNVSFLVMLNFLVICASYFGIWKIFRTKFSGTAKGFIPVSWLFFSLCQYSNFLLPWQLSLNLGIMGAIFAFYFAGKTSFKHLLLAFIFSTISSLSFGNGLLIFPFVLLYLVISKASFKKTGFWIILSILFFILYFSNYTSNGITPSRSPVGLGLFFLNLLSMVIVLPLGKAGGYFYYLGAMVGAAILLILITALAYFIRGQGSRTLREHVLRLVFLLYFFFILAQIAFGRAGSGTAGAFSAQYTTFVILFLIFLYSALFYLCREHDNFTLPVINNLLINPSFKVFKGLIFIAIIIGLFYGLMMGPYHSGGLRMQKYILLTYEKQSPQAKKALQGLEYVSGVDLPLFLKSNHKSVFADSQTGVDYSLLPVENIPLREKNSDIPDYFTQDTIVQTLICRINSVKSVTIKAECFKPGKNDFVDIFIYLDRERIQERRFSAREVFSHGDIMVRLDKELQDIKNKILTVRMVRGSESINIPSFAPYYGNEECVNEIPLIQGDCRVIGLELNNPAMMRLYYFMFSLKGKAKALLV